MFNLKKVIILVVLLTVTMGLFAASKIKDNNDMVISPNPMKDYTEIICSFDNSAYASLVITDLKGVVLKTIFTGQLEKGKHAFTWDGTDYRNIRLQEGTYVVELSYGTRFTSLKKFVILK